MDCDLVYALVPRTTLQGTLEEKAKQVVVARMAIVAHSMSLEAQAVSSAAEKEQLNSLIAELLAGNPKKLWDISNAA
jgi:hypothetical protein